MIEIFRTQLVAMRALFVSALILLAIVSPSHADDTEIFFGQSDESFETNPNIIFLLDVSGSMVRQDGTGVSRLNRMKNSMRLLLDQSTNYNVGIMSFQGFLGGAAVRYPLGDLDSDSSELCPNDICPDEVVLVRPLLGNDDAVQNNQTTQVSVNDDYLAMGQINPNSMADSAEDNSNLPEPENLITKTFIASSSGQENRNTKKSNYEWKRNQWSQRWFYGSFQLEPSLIGYQFQDIDIPKDSRIAEAKITFQFAGNNQLGDVSAFITGEQTANPLHFPLVRTGYSHNNHTFGERLEVGNRTTEVVPWNSIPTAATSAPGSNSGVTTPGVENIVNEIVALPDWRSGDTLSFIISPSDSYRSAWYNVRNLYGAGASEALRPVLSVTYEENEDKTRIIETINVVSDSHVDEFDQEFSRNVWQNTTNQTSTLFYVGGRNEPRRLALRFPNVNVPKDAKIESVFLNFGVRRDENSSWSWDWKLLGNPNSNTRNSAANNSWYYPSSSLVTINVNSELSADPAADTTTALSNRNLSAETVSWSTSAVSYQSGAVNDYEEDSPDLGPVVQSAIDVPAWQQGDSLSLVLSPSSNFSDNYYSSLQILTPSSNKKPELRITYSVPVSDADTDTNTPDNTEIPHTTAVRFRNVYVPPGATIKSARMIMHAATPNADAANFSIRGELSGNSEAFTAEDNDIGRRSSTNTAEIWQPEPWVAKGNQYSSVPIGNIVQEITNLSDWCSGNALTLMIEGSGNRFAQSMDSDPVYAPALEIIYATDSVSSSGYCSNTSIVTSSEQGTDDGSQNLSTGNLSLHDAYLSTERSESGTGSNVIGLRFNDIQLPQGAVITSAALEFSAAADMPNPFSVDLAIQNTDHAQPFSTNNNQDTINGRQYTSGPTWSHTGNVKSEETLSTVDIKELLTTQINRSDWTSGNSVAFKLEATSGVLDIVANDGDQTSIPRLVVYFQGHRQAPGGRHRGKIQQVVDDMFAVGGTPIVEAMYEAAQYIRGGQVDYGDHRGAYDYTKRYFRVSHPGSYNGGTVNRSEQCVDANLNSSLCASEVISHTPTPAVYKTPIHSQCQSNHLVLLSDGEASSNNAVAKTQTLIGANCDNRANSDERCGVELASWLFNTDQSGNFPEKQFVKTHTIGFHLEDPTFLKDIAEAGGGLYEPAESSAQLLTAFKRIINNVDNRSASFVTPGATVSQFNRLKNSNDVYYAMFKPSGTSRWEGNIKRYKIGTNDENEFAIFDSNDNEAVNPNTGSFSSTSKSFWSSVIDGDNVELGGAAEQLHLGFENYTQRKVYTFNKSNGVTDLTSAVNRFDPSNQALNKAAFKLPTLIENDTEAYSKIVAWGKGGDIQDEDGDDNRTELRAHMGDPMHSVPLVTNYADGETVLYMATNEGFLHALDTDSGEEHFAFIPEELYENVYKFYQNEALANRPYGLDGGKTLWHDDTNKNGLIDPTEKAILYVAMRRGGNSYFALDISNYKTPKYLWSIQGGEETAKGLTTTTARGDYRNLASTWSLPVKTKIMHRSEARDVIIFGGGYDAENQDPTADTISSGQLQTAEDVRSADTTGHAIFIADANTGDLIWQTNPADGFGEMIYSIPSGIRILDINFDGLVDQLYVGDMGGQLWRMDFDNNLVSTDDIGSRISAGIIADIAGDTPETNRKFYYPPDVSLISMNSQQLLSIVIGTGWRAHPLDDIIEDRIYSFRSPNVFDAPQDKLGKPSYQRITELDKGLIDVTNDIRANVDASALGWYIRFEREGEKVLGSSLTFNNQLLFTSYKPSEVGFSCEAAIGSGYVYALNVLNGSPILNLDGIGGEGDLRETDRGRVLASPGLPPEVSVLFPESEKNTNTGSNDQPLFQVGKETITELDGGDISQAVFWQEVSESHEE